MYSLVPLVYNPADKRGDQYKATVAMTLGDWVYTSGTSAVNGVTYGLVRKATTGLYGFTSKFPASSAAGTEVSDFGVVFREPHADRGDNEVSDTNWNTIDAASTVIVFYGGEFRTSRFNSSNITISTPPGTKLYVNTSAQLDVKSGVDDGDFPVAKLIAYHEAGSTDYIDFRIL